MRPGYDFVSHDAFPNDRSGHGTFVASAIAAAADNHFGMVGVAYRADIMPVRVLDSLGEGSSGAIAPASATPSITARRSSTSRSSSSTC